MRTLFWITLCCAFALMSRPAIALDRPDVTFKVFQFPADQIPRIDGKTDDWEMVPADYTIGTDQLVDDEGGHTKPDPKDLDVKVKVGWVKGLNRLYFLYEAYDNYWDFSRPDLHNDMFEIVVDADLSGGMVIDQAHADVWSPAAVGELSVKDPRAKNLDLHWAGHGVTAQNYHVFTPALDKDWCMAWSSATWIKELPFANSKCVYDFKPGESGKLVLEFWITPFDYAGPEGPQRAVESVLSEDKLIGMSFAIIDYDDVNAATNKRSFWNLSRHHTMFGNASQLCGFKLMPLEDKFRKPIDCNWSFKVIDMDRHLVAFKDLTDGKATSWKWTFGDGETSTEQNPIHEYKTFTNNMTVILEVDSPAGKAKRSKVWDIQMK